MMLRLFFNAETQRRGDAENNPCVSAPLRLCVKNFSFLLPPFSFLLPPSLLRPLHGRNHAFTLIETALAMLAIGLGLLAIFGLGRLSLQAAKETEHDQRCVMMADAVFETLRDYNARFVDEARENGIVWSKRWESVTNNTTTIPFPPIAGMSASTEIPLAFTGSSNFAATFDKDNLSLTDWNPLYSLAGTFTYSSPISGHTNGLHITLIIHPDGLTYSSDQRVFRTTLTNPGGLP